ncbi:MAG: hypothetical protein B6D59_07575 [Campylobacteraceae bacterium 4484_4]|nr:MAG: hypothetical protein B6D59_07575 [Campylobacteraceae bacterium 4484_4]
MTKPSTKGCSITLSQLKLDRSYYYVKRRSIVEKITFDHRTFYAKFEKIDEALSDTVISQHLNRQYTIAAPLLTKGKTNYLVIEYRGSEPLRFYHTSKHLMRTLLIDDYCYFEGKRDHYIQLFIPVDSLPLEEADESVRKISDALAMRLPREWKSFPDITLPESYNIITLPYSEYSPSH